MLCTVKTLGISRIWSDPYYVIICWVFTVSFLYNAHSSANKQKVMFSNFRASFFITVFLCSSNSQNTEIKVIVWKNVTPCFVELSVYICEQLRADTGSWLVCYYFQTLMTLENKLSFFSVIMKNIINVLFIPYICITLILRYMSCSGLWWLEFNSRGTQKPIPSCTTCADTGRDNCLFVYGMFQHVIHLAH